MGIIDNEFEGQSERHPLLRWVYVLSDGRQVKQFEHEPGVPGTGQAPTPKQSEELSRLASLGRGEFQGTVQAEAYGKPFVFRKYAFKLSDGTAVTRWEGEPAGRKTDLTKADWNELNELMKARKGETVGTYEEEVMGKVLRFTREKFVLSDGTVVISSRGVPPGER